MSITASQQTNIHRRGLPAAAAAAGLLAYGLAFTAGQVFDLNSGGAPVTRGDIAAYVGIASAGTAIALWFAYRAWGGAPSRLSHTALGLSLAAAITFVAFWSGWPEVFGAVGAVLAVEHRRRVGSFSPATVAALVVGVVASAVAAYICIVG